jgi:hypothetical protein
MAIANSADFTYVGYTLGGTDPTLYFNEGRYTQVHANATNIGWHPRGNRTCTRINISAAGVAARRGLAATKNAAVAAAVVAAAADAAADAADAAAADARDASTAATAASNTAAVTAAAAADAADADASTAAAAASTAAAAATALATAIAASAAANAAADDAAEADDAADDADAAAADATTAKIQAECVFAAAVVAGTYTDDSATGVLCECYRYNNGNYTTHRSRGRLFRLADEAFDARFDNAYAQGILTAGVLAPNEL